MIQTFLAWLKQPWAWISGRRTRTYRPVFVIELPEAPARGILYCIGGGALWSAAFKCPCGCDALIQLSLLAEERPHWSLDLTGNSATVHPSVWRRSGCCSHFHIRGGSVVWC